MLVESFSRNAFIRKGRDQRERRGRKTLHGLGALPPLAFLRWTLGAIAVFGVTGCRSASKPSVDDTPRGAGRSPNVTMTPAPLASTSPIGTHEDDTAPSTGETKVGVPADSRGRSSLADAGPPTTTLPLIANKPLPPESSSSREISGVTMMGEWLWTDASGPPHGPEVSPAGIDAAKKATRRQWQVDISDTGRMRVLFDAVSFTLPHYSELRARTDRYGHVLLWPNGESYRIVPPGALRALLDERRNDVTPLMPARVRTGKQGMGRFGFPSTRVELSTASARLVIEQVHATNASLGGPLLCRLLVEIAAAEPSTSACSSGLVPVHAEYIWPSGGTIHFDVYSFVIRSDFSTSSFACPPPAATFQATGLPAAGSGIFLTREQIAAFRMKAIEGTRPRTDPEAAGAPGEGFVMANETDALRFAVVDGVATAWVPAHERQYIIGSPRGRYSVQWRSFLGSFVEPPRTVEFPAFMTLGGIQNDAGPVPGGGNP